MMKSIGSVLLVATLALQIGCKAKSDIIYYKSIILHIPDTWIKLSYPTDFTTVKAIDVPTNYREYFKSITRYLAQSNHGNIFIEVFKLQPRAAELERGSISFFESNALENIKSAAKGEARILTKELIRIRDPLGGFDKVSPCLKGNGKTEEGTDFIWGATAIVDEGKLITVYMTTVASDEADLELKTVLGHIYHLKK